MNTNYTGLSLFTGAGGMDTGFEDAGVDVVWANELVQAAADTFSANHPQIKMVVGDITQHYGDLPDSEGKPIDIVFGGPPCQGFSVAGKMDPADPRSQMIFAFLDVVERVQPQAFVMENVKALGSLTKWSEVREKYLERVRSLGYSCEPFICLATDFGVSQKRERVFFIGIKGDLDFKEIYAKHLLDRQSKPKTVKELLSDLDPAGTGGNPLDCVAKITYAKKPVVRSTPWAGMYFNGAGRPIDLDGYANTLPASMGGNKTPIIDEDYLRGNSDEMWMVKFHEDIASGKISSGTGEVPKRLRRLTIAEAARIQTFPDDYIWKGGKSAVYKQIGNAVPVKLAEAVAGALLDTLQKMDISPKRAS